MSLPSEEGNRDFRNLCKKDKSVGPLLNIAISKIQNFTLKYIKYIGNI